MFTFHYLCVWVFSCQVYSAAHNVSLKHWKDYNCPSTDPKNPVYPLHNIQWFYKTMVTAMDRSIGMILNALAELGIENNTLVLFTSDNGPENGAGTGGIFKKGKRSLHVSMVHDCGEFIP
jgi:membrane-anchored protein YejM (alkaline phosphatase superfamily)